VVLVYPWYGSKPTSAASIFCGSLDDGFRGLSTGTVLLLPDFVIVGVLSGGVAAIAFATMSNLD
jgi:hypothetical protein